MKSAAPYCEVPVYNKWRRGGQKGRGVVVLDMKYFVL